MSLRAWRFRLRLLAATFSALVAAGSRDAAHAQSDPSWEAARRANTIEAYERYLSENPTGPNSAEAFSAIVAISRGLVLETDDSARGSGAGLTRGLGVSLGAEAATGGATTSGFAQAIY